MLEIRHIITKIKRKPLLYNPVSLVVLPVAYIQMLAYILIFPALQMRKPRHSKAEQHSLDRSYTRIQVF